MFIVIPPTESKLVNAIKDFASQYADQTEADWAKLLTAMESCEGYIIHGIAQVSPRPHHQEAIWLLLQLREIV
jgi:hypothetical protein